jgi:hypothetical protein
MAHGVRVSCVCGVWCVVCGVWCAVVVGGWVVGRGRGAWGRGLVDVDAHADEICDIRSLRYVIGVVWGRGRGRGYDRVWMWMRLDYQLPATC